jgi:iron complex outermembrane receptor protein
VDPFKVYRDEEGYVHTKALGEAFRVAYETPEVKFLSITAHRDWQQQLLQDFDFTGNQVRNGFSNPTLDQWSQEFRVQSADPDARLRWLAGFFFLDALPTTESGSVEYLPITLSTTPAPLVTQPTSFTTQADNVNRSYALFGQGSYAITEAFSAIAGVRFECDTREMSRQKTVYSPNATFGGFPIGALTNTYGVYETSANYERVIPKAGLSYRFKPELEAYFSFSSGYQSGGFNASTDSPAASSYLPWISWQYEVGLKSAWYENRLQAHVALFLIDSQNYQVYRLNALDPTQAYVQNAAQATAMGAELELIAHPAEGLDLSIGAGYVDPVNRVSYSGNTIPFVPEFTATGALQYRFPFGLYLRVEGQGVGSYYLTEDNVAEQPVYGLLNARIGYAAKHWEVFVYGRNLTNKQYTSNALDLRNLYQPDLLILQPGDPLTFGIALTAKF